jgi:hypothetical protein
MSSLQISRGGGDKVDRNLKQEIRREDEGSITSGKENNFSVISFLIVYHI